MRLQSSWRPQAESGRDGVGTLRVQGYPVVKYNRVKVI